MSASQPTRYRHTIMDGLVVEFGPVSASKNMVVIHGSPSFDSAKGKIALVRQIFNADRAYGILHRGRSLDEDQFREEWRKLEDERKGNVIRLIVDAKNQDYPL